MKTEEIIDQKLADFKAQLLKELSPKAECCDCCLTQQEDVRLSPDGCGFTCVSCIGLTFENSLAVKKYMEITSHSKIELQDWFESLKIS